MNEEETFALFVVVAGIVVLGIGLASLAGRRRQREARLRVIEQALRHPTLDQATRTELMRVLAADGRGDHVAPRASCGRWWRGGYVLFLAGSWLTFVIGGGLWILRETMNWYWIDEEATAVTVVVGFALLTLPLALRELLGRRGPAVAPQR